MSAARNRRECAGVNARREREANVGHVEPSAKRARAPKAAKPTLQVPCDPSVFQQRLTAAGLPACFTGPLQLIGLCSREAQVAASAATVGEATWLSTADVALVVAVALGTHGDGEPPSEHEDEEDSGEQCRKCNHRWSGERGRRLVLCEAVCGFGLHLKCFPKAKERLPGTAWYCELCERTGKAAQHRLRPKPSQPAV